MTTEPLSAIAPDGVPLGDEREIPDGVARLIGLATHPLRVKTLTSTSCVLTWGPDIEFRFQARGGGDWEWDEIVGKFWVHVEQMSASHYWMGLHPLGPDGQELDHEDHEQVPSRVCVDLTTRKAALRMTGWLD